MTVELQRLMAVFLLSLGLVSCASPRAGSPPGSRPSPDASTTKRDDAPDLRAEIRLQDSGPSRQWQSVIEVRTGTEVVVAIKEDPEEFPTRIVAGVETTRLDPAGDEIRGVLVSADALGVTVRQAEEVTIVIPRDTVLSLDVLEESAPKDSKWNGALLGGGLGFGVVMAAGGLVFGGEDAGENILGAIWGATGFGVGALLGAVIDSRHPARTRRPIYRAASEATPDASGSSSADVQPAPPSAKQYRWLRVRNQMRPSASAGVP